MRCKGISHPSVTSIASGLVILAFVDYSTRARSRTASVGPHDAHICGRRGVQWHVEVGRGGPVASFAGGSRFWIGE